MDRRAFLQRLGFGAALVAVDPAKLLRAPPADAEVLPTPLRIVAPVTPLPPVTGDLLASGGLCAPVSPFYKLKYVGVAGRPVKDSLPAFRGARSGIRYRLPEAL